MMRSARGPRSKDIANDMQPIDSQHLNHAAERNDHRIGLARFQNGLHHLAVIAFFIRRIVAEQHFLHQRAHLARHRVAARVFGCISLSTCGDFQQPVNRQPVPLRVEHPCFFEQRQLLVR